MTLLKIMQVLIKMKIFNVKQIFTACLLTMS